ncbi:MAG TPA: cation:dicarboxylase symporter family transporter [Terriglobales bacterium]|nr:cation:dicarboxylase symporter family transporter [Terriglobales bacterium]
MKRGSLTSWIFLGLVLGVAIGAWWPHLGVELEPLETIFLRLIKMVVGPLIFATLVVGIAGQGELRGLGRVAVKAMVLFEVATTLALVLGLWVVNLVRPGAGAHLQAGSGADLGTTAAHTNLLQAMIVHTVPQSFAQALANGEILQVVVFSVLFAVAMVVAGVGEGRPAQPLLQLCEALAKAMFKLTEMVMWTAPLGVLGAMAASIGGQGLGVVGPLLKLVATLYGALVVFVVVVLGGAMALFRIPLGRFWAAVRGPALIAFSTSSSEAALPSALENMEAMGVPAGIVGFVIPAGYSFNLTGSTLYLSLATMFIAQAAGMHLSVGQQVFMLLTLMLTSKGVAGVSRAAIVVLAATAITLGLPLAGVALLLGVDQFLDMGRTAVNVLGNCLAAAVVARWEGATIQQPSGQTSLQAPEEPVARRG